MPSRFDEPATGLATIVLIATDWPDDLARALAGLRATCAGRDVRRRSSPTDRRRSRRPRSRRWPARPATPRTRPGRGRLDERAPRLRGRDEHRPAPGDRPTSSSSSTRASQPTGDLVTPLVRALDDPTVAVVGGWGIVSADLRKFEDAPAGDVDAIEGYVQGFRRADAAARGPLDERFRYYRNLDIWWSLVLRDEGEGSPPRRAVSLDGLPAVRHDHRGFPSLLDDERDRQSKRNFYRIIDRFGWRTDLLVSR